MRTTAPVATCSCTNPVRVLAPRFGTRRRRNLPAQTALVGVVPLAYLNGPHDRRLMVDAVSLALGTAANQRLIHFDRILRSDSVALRSHHAGAQLVAQLKSRFVAGHAQLPLKRESRLAGCLGRHKVRTLEPYRQRGVTTHHDGACHERPVGLARAAPQDDRSSLGEAVRLTDLPHFMHVNPCGHRRCARYRAHAASSGNTR